MPLPRSAADVPNGPVPNNPGLVKVQQWEYKVVTLEPLDVRKPNTMIDGQKQADGFTDYFNKLAKDGWEYESHLSGSGAVYDDYYLFKRPKR